MRTRTVVRRAICSVCADLPHRRPPVGCAGCGIAGTDEPVVAKPVPASIVKAPPPIKAPVTAPESPMVIERHSVAIRTDEVLAIGSDVFRALLVEVADRYGVTADDILTADRHKAIARARHVAIYVARGRWGWSYPELGRRFRRGEPLDHTTCMSACRRIGQVRERGGAEAAFIDRLLARLPGGEHLALVPGQGLELMEAAS